jgi:molybdopterin-guanine dinucleotide biosynthesis protein A
MNRGKTAAIEAARTLHGVILAGGKSTRFGQDKTQMELAGKWVLPALLWVLKHFPFQGVAVVTDSVTRHRLPADVDILEDDWNAIGPIGGVATALRRLPNGILVLACDMPLVSVALTEWLLSEYDPKVHAVIPRSQDRLEPLPGIYLARFLPVLEQAIADKRHALHQVLQTNQVRYLEVPARFERRHELANINTAQEHGSIEALLKKRR